MFFPLNKSNRNSFHYSLCIHFSLAEFTIFRKNKHNCCQRSPIIILRWILVKRRRIIYLKESFYCKKRGKEIQKRWVPALSLCSHMHIPFLNVTCDCHMKKYLSLIIFIYGKIEKVFCRGIPISLSCAKDRSMLLILLCFRYCCLFRYKRITLAHHTAPKKVIIALER